MHRRTLVADLDSALHLVHQRPKVVDVFEAAVHAGKADVGDFVELFELAHDHLAQPGGGHFAHTEVEQLFFDAVNGGVDQFGADRPLAQCQGERGAQFGGNVVDAAAVFFDDRWEVDLGPFVGGEALFATATLAAAAHEVALFRGPSFNDLGFQMTAERALHGSACREAPNRGVQQASGWATQQLVPSLRGAATRKAAQRGGVTHTPGSGRSAR
jgi:hypothetical protein